MNLAKRHVYKSVDGNEFFKNEEPESSESFTKALKVKLLNTALKPN